MNEVESKNWLLYYLFEKLSFICTHYLVVIRKEKVLDENNTRNRGR